MIGYLRQKYWASFSQKKLPSLDGIRAISCLFVIFGHFAYLYTPFFKNKLGSILGETLAMIIGSQDTGVTFFFVLSGFLITSFLISEYKATNTISFKSFFIKRVFRIFPAYYFYFACILIWIYQYHLVEISTQDIVSTVTYTNNYFSLLNPWQIGHFWSLSVEEQFYLVWPILFLLFFKRLGFRLPWLIILISPLLRIFTYIYFPEWRPRISILTHTRFDCLMFGCLLAYYFHEGYFKLFNAYIRKYYLHLVAAFQIFGLTRFLLLIFKGKYLMTIGYSLDSLCMCILIIYLIENKSLFSRFLNLPIMVHLGTLSYSLYLWQMPFTWSKLGTEHLLFRIVAIYTCALFSYLFVESPFMTLRERFQKR